MCLENSRCIFFQHLCASLRGVHVPQSNLAMWRSAESLNSDIKEWRYYVHQRKNYQSVNNRDVALPKSLTKIDQINFSKRERGFTPVVYPHKRRWNEKRGTEIRKTKKTEGIVQD